MPVSSSSGTAPSNTGRASVGSTADCTGVRCMATSHSASPLTGTVSSHVRSTSGGVRSGSVHVSVGPSRGAAGVALLATASSPLVYTCALGTLPIHNTVHVSRVSIMLPSPTVSTLRSLRARAVHRAATGVAGAVRVGPPGGW